jgi:hypothetical protein
MALTSTRTVARRAGHKPVVMMRPDAPGRRLVLRCPLATGHDREQPDRSAPEHRHGVAVVDLGQLRAEPGGGVDVRQHDGLLVRHLVGQLDQPDVGVGRITPRGSPFDDALEALGVAVGAVVRALGPARSRWHVVAALTSTMLLAPSPPLLP